MLFYNFYKFKKMSNPYVYHNTHPIEIKNIKNSINNTINNLENIENIKNFELNNKKCSKLCFNFIKGFRCKWFEQGRCKYAHSIEELNLSSIIKILELGMQSFYYIYGEQKETNKDFSIFDLVNIYKNTELLFRQEHYNLYKSRVQYDELHKYIFKLKKELELQHEIGTLHLSSHINELVNSNHLDINIKNNFKELKTLINSTIGCKICYKNIIEFKDYQENEEEKYDDLKKNYNIINLSCGHSICEHCFIELVNKKANIFIECPLCRNINDINNSKPNFELNEQIFNIKLIFSKLNKIHNTIEKNYKQLNTNNFIIKNKENKGFINKSEKKNIIIIKSFEAPW